MKSPSRPSSHEQVRKALDLAEEADRLEDRGDKKSAVLKLADACAILYEEALVHPSLKKPLEKMLLRAERLKAESIWDCRVVTKALYETATGPTSPRVVSQEEPKGKGTFVAEVNKEKPA